MSLTRIQTLSTHFQLTFLFFIMTAVATFPADVMIGMLRKGNTGNEILDILNVLVPDETELTREQFCDELGIADCPESDDEIASYF